MNYTVRMIGLTLLLAATAASMPVRAEDDAWADFRFLIGSWLSDDKPDQSSGRFTLEPELGGKILVRRNTAMLTASNGRPASKHEDLMVVFAEPGGKQFRASYWDNEGHVIQYAVAMLPDNKGLSMTSDAGAPGPRFRLTYTKGESDKVVVKFEIMPPGQTEFRKYLEGTVRRKKAEE
jgi:hypothetical protein